jgi:hypothetical protein
MLGRLVGGALDRLTVSNVGGDDQRFAAELLDLARRGFEPVAAARQQGDAAAAAGELARGGPADSGGRTGDDDNLCQPTSA